MQTTPRSMITVETTVHAPIEKIWKMWTEPVHIRQWNNASDDWHTPSSSNDLRKGGKFVARMEAKDGSFGFDFSGTYDEVREHELIAFTLEDGRKVVIHFTPENGDTTIVETFDAEEENSLELQKSGWQAILDSFKRYVESH